MQKRKSFFSQQKATWLLISLLAFNIFYSPLQLQAAELTLEANSAVLIEASTGRILYEVNSQERQAPASVTKLMTLVVALEAIENGRAQFTDTVVASENAWRLGGSQIYLEPGEEMSLEELLISIAVGSANDACVAVAEHLYGSHEEFVVALNQKAQDLGLKNTHFVNCYGLPAEGHYTTALDMALIGQYALKFPKIKELTSIKEYDLRDGAFHLYNTNKMLWWYAGADGFKTGWTNEAKYCLASTAERDGMRLIAVVFGSPQRHGNFRDCMKLLDYGFNRYMFKPLAGNGEICGLVPVGKGTLDSVDVVVENQTGALVPKGQDKDITVQTELPALVNAPITQGQKLGEFVVYQGGQELSRTNLVAIEAVPRASAGKQILNFFGEMIQLNHSPFGR